MSTIHTFGGRKFREARASTFEHDLWTMDHLRASGIDRIVQEEKEAPEATGVRMFNALVASGRQLDLLGALLMPAEIDDDLDWTPELARETARFLGRLHLPEDKRRIEDLLATLVAGFFVAGVLFHGTFPASSASPTFPSDSTRIAGT